MRARSAVTPDDKQRNGTNRNLSTDADAALDLRLRQREGGHRASMPFQMRLYRQFR